MEEDLSETREKKAETLAEMRCDSHHQIFEIEDKVYEMF